MTKTLASVTGVVALSANSVWQFDRFMVFKDVNGVTDALGGMEQKFDDIW